jgi:hypothetical protein
VTLKDRAVADYQTLRGNVADYGPWRLNFEFFVGLYVGHDFTLNEDRSGRYFTFYGSLLADGYVCLGNDFPFDFAIYSSLTVEVEFAVNFGAGAQVCADIR